jgi:amino acid adenylation domain-containing protein/non-ribosomal peptide synthase protein (TIGR01720 family)
VDENVYQFIWSYHHLLLDGWSVSFVLKEVFDFYEAFCLGQNLHLEPSRPYQDYIAWLQQQDLVEAKAYWQQVLSGIHVPTPLGVDRALASSTTEEESYAGQQRHLSVAATAALQSFARQHQLTVNTLVQGAWALLLSCYSGQEDVVFGTTVFGRPPTLTGVESMVGLFINTLPMRIQVSSQTSLVEWLKQLQAQLWEMRSYEYSPLAQVQGWSEIPRGLPLFESIVVFENYPIDTSFHEQNRSLNICQEGCFERANYPLTVAAMPSEELLLYLGYDCRRFDAATINRMLGHLQTLLEGMVADQEQQLADLPMLTEPERHQLLVEWNDTQTDYPAHQCIHQLFEAQVERTPDAVAVVFADNSLTVGELNRRANKIAHHLRSLGVGADTLVALYLERSVEMIVGLLAILKAGGAYLPIDTAYPGERVALMLEDAQVPILLTQKHLLEQLPPHKAQVICLDTDWQTFAQQSQENLPTLINPDNLAYVIYTSGSTGKPKGVAVSHRAVNRLVFHTNYINFQPDDRVAQVSNVAFDAATFEIWGALLHGGQLIGIDKDISLSAEEFAAYIQQQQISTLFLTTALFNQLANVVPGAFKNLRQLLFGGEAANVGCVKEILKNGSPQRLLHVYGPTESTTFSCWYLVEQIAPEATNLPIGKPISNTQIYILNRHLQPVPIGVAGEVYIGGAGVARGYLNRPDLNAEKFIPNPFSQQQGSKLYKTGDLARYLSDGNIEFLGRLDNQVKIRGFRIELGEIEVTLSQHPAVQEAVVTATEDIPGNHRLVAYVVPKQESVCAIAQLQQFLKQKLPEYMLPSTIVELSALPLTPNGKVDRRALPVPETTRPDLAGALIAPRTPTEEILAGIWSEILGLEQVGVNDNFFELGGDSILSIQIVSRANQAGLQLTPKLLFQHQTIAELSTVVGIHPSVTAKQGLVIGEVPLTPIQHWFFAQNQPEPHHFNQSVLLLVPPDLKRSLLAQVVQQILVHHDALRLRFVSTDSGWQQINADAEVTVPFEVVDLSGLEPQEQQATLESIAAKQQSSLNLSEGPLLRVVLFAMGKHQPSRLLLIVHHLAVDGVSWRILLEDLASSYQQLQRGEAIQLPPKTTSFQAWAKKLWKYGQSEALASQWEYWLTQLDADVPPLPVDYPVDRQINTVASEAQVSVSLSVEQTRALLQEVPSVYNTQINDVLLAALVQSFGQWTGERQHSLVVDLEGHGREELFADVDLSRTVGWFTSLFPVRLELPKDDHPGEVLKSVKEQLRRLPQQGIGYGILRYLSPDEAMRFQLQHLPQPEVSFNYLGQLDGVLSASPLLGFATESAGSPVSSLGVCNHLLEINAFVVNGKLQLDWTYSQNIHHRETVERFAFGFIDALQSLIDHCQLQDAGGYTPSDFPEAELSQEELDQLMTTID